MTTAYDVPAKALIDELAKKLQKDPSIVPPEGSNYARTGVDKENPPVNPDWWFTRCGSLLRKIYIHNTIGVEQLRTLYGGGKNRGSKPYKARSGSGSFTRKALQQLEKAGLVTKIRGKGRVLTPKGRSFLDNTSHELMKKM